MSGRARVACAVLLVMGLVGGGLGSAAGAAGSVSGDSPALGDGRRVVELKAPTPEWYTPELHERVVAAGQRGETVPLPPAARDEVDVGLLFAGIRPGAWMIFPAWCTLNFVFGGDAYVGTAGHCAEAGEEVTIVAAPGVLMNIGRTVTSIDNGVGDDFALIEISAEMREWVNPSMAVVAGPTGDTSPAFGDPILHVGHGVAIGTGGTPRAGIVTWLGEGDEAGGYGWTGAASPGDSGSGVRTASGEAVGNLTHLIVGVPYAPADVAGTSIDRILQIAGSVSTASLVPDPLP